MGDHSKPVPQSDDRGPIEAVVAARVQVMHTGSACSHERGPIEAISKAVEVTISIPDQLGRELAKSPGELSQRLQTDLAVQYYERGLVSVGRAAEMSGLSRLDFEQVLGERRVVRNYSDEDLRADLEFARTGIPGRSAQTST